METNIKKQTVIGNSYWNCDGAYQKEYNELYEKMVPEQGSCNTLNGELIRAVSRLSYEYFNNGNCNACEAHEAQNDGWYGGYKDDEEWEEETEYEYNVSSYYGKFLQIIEETIKTDEVARLISLVEEIIVNSCEERFQESMFSEENRLVYDRLVDEVVYYVLTNEDKELPEKYVEKR